MIGTAERRKYTSKIKLGQILDLIDETRNSAEIVRIMNCNGQIRAEIRVNADIWEGIEDRTVNSMTCGDGGLELWLDD